MMVDVMMAVGVAVDLIAYLRIEQKMQGVA